MSLFLYLLLLLYLLQKKTRNDIILIVHFRSWERVGYSLEGNVFKNVFSVIILSNDNQKKKKKHCKIDNFQVPVDVVDKDTVVVAAAVAIAVAAAAAFVL